jgi:hypothetical protein
LDAITVHARAALGSIVSECASLNVLLDTMIGNLLFGSHRESVYDSTHRRYEACRCSYLQLSSRRPLDQRDPHLKNEQERLILEATRPMACPTPRTAASGRAQLCRAHKSTDDHHPKADVWPAGTNTRGFLPEAGNRGFPYTRRTKLCATSQCCHTLHRVFVAVQSSPEHPI